ncbi:hypothetical protein N0V83_010967 [Neocucurbitaria cava]|uniref:Uncharacterized protein n=1 Tax=Neocucurbitaria cava TaxID=798079 RepID=A0A9W9CHC0_9PLEO|nr:hypothetical protein N0V83_010967 [Neocucurbitaria cava]
MSKFGTDCLTQITIQPNSTILAGIEACQAAANTTFCYPPNGTRICAPAEDTPFFWPTGYYNNDSRLNLDYEGRPGVLFLRKNTGNGTQDFTPYLYDYKATEIPGVQNEKTIEMYFEERRLNDELDPMNLKTYHGPTLILVKTAEWPTMTSASSRATATAKSPYSSDDDDDDGKPKLHPGAIVGIVLGSIVAAVAIFFLCCRNCCCGAKRTPRPKVDKQKQAHLIDQGRELMEKRGGTTGNGGDKSKAAVSSANVGLVGNDGRSLDDLVRAEEARSAQRRVETADMPHGGVPPPKYTP